MSNPILTKKYHFCASHKYGNDFWSDEKNLESEMLKTLIESKNGLEKILDDSKNIENFSNEKNSLSEVTKEIESVLNKIKMLQFSEEE